EPAGARTMRGDAPAAAVSPPAPLDRPVGRLLLSHRGAGLAVPFPLAGGFRQLPDRGGGRGAGRIAVLPQVRLSTTPRGGPDTADSPDSQYRAARLVSLLSALPAGQRGPADAPARGSTRVRGGHRGLVPRRHGAGEPGAGPGESPSPAAVDRGRPRGGGL